VTQNKQLKLSVPKTLVLETPLNTILIPENSILESRQIGKGWPLENNNSY
jgi:hypothetical protein